MPASVFAAAFKGRPIDADVAYVLHALPLQFCVP